MIKKIFFSLVTTLIFLGVVEGIFRALSVVDAGERKAFVDKRWYSDFMQADKTSPLMAYFVAHPFWGMSYNPNFPESNNYGFDSLVDYPYVKKNSNELVIAVLGGSVAGVAAEPIEISLKNELEKHLKERCSPNIKVINLAISATKQPSQFHIYSYFNDSFDLSISLDGHNDAFSDSEKEVPGDFPSFYTELYNVTPNKLSLLNRIYLWTQLQFKVVVAVKDRVAWTKSDLLFWASRQLTEIADHMKFMLLSKIKNTMQLPSEDHRKKNISVWEKYIHLQHILSQKLNRPSFFFLQPSQYAAKPLSEVEKISAIDRNAERVHAFKDGYIQMSQSVIALQKKGVDITDLSHLYAKTPESIFIDSCCHLNSRGNELLAQTITQRVLPTVLERHRCAL